MSRLQHQSVGWSSHQRFHGSLQVVIQLLQMLLLRRDLLPELRQPEQWHPSATSHPVLKPQGIRLNGSRGKGDGATHFSRSWFLTNMSSLAFSRLLNESLQTGRDLMLASCSIREQLAPFRGVRARSGGLALPSRTASGPGRAGVAFSHADDGTGDGTPLEGGGAAQGGTGELDDGLADHDAG